MLVCLRLYETTVEKLESLGLHQFCKWQKSTQDLVSLFIRRTYQNFYSLYVLFAVFLAGLSPLSFSIIVNWGRWSDIAVVRAVSSFEFNFRFFSALLLALGITSWNKATAYIG